MMMMMVVVVVVVIKYYRSNILANQIIIARESMTTLQCV